MLYLALRQRWDNHGFTDCAHLGCPSVVGRMAGDSCFEDFCLNGKDRVGLLNRNQSHDELMMTQRMCCRGARQFKAFQGLAEDNTLDHILPVPQVWTKGMVVLFEGAKGTNACEPGPRNKSMDVVQLGEAAGEFADTDVEGGPGGLTMTSATHCSSTYEHKSEEAARISGKGCKGHIATPSQCLFHEEGDPLGVDNGWGKTARRHDPRNLLGLTGKVSFEGANERGAAELVGAREVTVAESIHRRSEHQDEAESPVSRGRTIGGATATLHGHTLRRLRDDTSTRAFLGRAGVVFFEGSVDDRPRIEAVEAGSKVATTTPTLRSSTPQHNGGSHFPEQLTEGEGGEVATLPHYLQRGRGDDDQSGLDNKNRTTRNDPYIRTGLAVSFRGAEEGTPPMHGSAAGKRTATLAGPVHRWRWWCVHQRKAESPFPQGCTEKDADTDGASDEDDGDDDDTTNIRASLGRAGVVFFERAEAGPKNRVTVEVAHAEAGEVAMTAPTHRRWMRTQHQGKRAESRVTGTWTKKGELASPSQRLPDHLHGEEETKVARHGPSMFLLHTGGVMSCEEGADAGTSECTMADTGHRRSVHQQHQAESPVSQEWANGPRGAVVVELAQRRSVCQQKAEESPVPQAWDSRNVATTQLLGRHRCAFPRPLFPASDAGMSGKHSTTHNDARICLADSVSFDGTTESRPKNKDAIKPDHDADGREEKAMTTELAHASSAPKKKHKTGLLVSQGGQTKATKSAMPLQFLSSGNDGESDMDTMHQMPRTTFTGQHPAAVRAKAISSTGRAAKPVAAGGFARTEAAMHLRNEAHGKTASLCVQWRDKGNSSTPQLRDCGDDDGGQPPDNKNGRKTALRHDFVVIIYAPLVLCGLACVLIARFARISPRPEGTPVSTGPGTPSEHRSPRVSSGPVSATRVTSEVRTDSGNRVDPPLAKNAPVLNTFRELSRNTSRRRRPSLAYSSSSPEEPWLLIPLEEGIIGNALSTNCSQPVHHPDAQKATGQTENSTRASSIEIHGEARRDTTWSSSTEAQSLSKSDLEKVELEKQLQACVTQIEDLKHSVSNLQVENDAFDAVRRHMHNQIQELKGNIRVFVRVRPRPDGSSEDGSPAPLTIGRTREGQQSLDLSLNTSVVGKQMNIGGRDKVYHFEFDRIFEGSNQGMVFREISQLVQSAMDGYHVCIFAYGQTGSGKTYTMEGDEGHHPERDGVIPRTVKAIFSGTKALQHKKGWVFTLHCSFLEIYNEEVRDLLSVTSLNQKLELKHEEGQVRVPGARLASVKNASDCMKMLELARNRRTSARTTLNHRSSRSHTIFQLYISGSFGDEHVNGMLNLVDLAGSERVSKCGSPVPGLKETKAINASLHALAHVLTSLANKESHIPYRNSKLTRLLQGSLGGASKVLMFANIASNPSCLLESLCTLRFADKVRKTRLDPPKSSAHVKLSEELEGSENMEGLETTFV